MSGFMRLFCLILAVTAARVQAQPRVHPYLEIGQVVTADLEPAGPVLTYSRVAAGLDVTQNGRRSALQASYRYERIIGWGPARGDRSQHLGLVRGQVAVVPGILDVDGGALATQVRRDFGGAAPLGQPGALRDLTQLYSVYGGVRLHPHIGLLQTQAGYHLGYSRADVRQPGLPGANQRFGDALAQDATLSIGMAPGPLPFGWSVNAGWAREDQSSVQDYFITRGVRADILLPLVSNLALTGGLGQDWDQGWHKPDPGSSNAPKLLYELEGRNWDVGLYWRPSPRTSVRARYGQRRGSDVFLAEARWQPDAHDYVSAVVFDAEQSFSLSLARQMAGLPTQFTTSSFGFSDSGAACAFGVDQSGSCLNGVLASPRLGLYRARGATLTWSRHVQRWTLGLGVGGTRRDFLAPGLLQSFRTDQIYFGQAHLGYDLTPRTEVNSDMTVSVYRDGNGVESEAARASLGLVHYLSRRWTARGQMGAAAAWSDSADRLSLWGQAGLRYAF